MQYVTVYDANSTRKRLEVKVAYRAEPEKRKFAARAYYRANTDSVKAVFRECHIFHHGTRLKYFRKYHCFTKKKAVKSHRFSLAQPTSVVVDQYLRNVQANLLADRERERCCINCIVPWLQID